MPTQRQDHEDTSGGHTRPFKKPRVISVGIYQAKNGFTILNVNSEWNFAWLIHIYVFLISLICLCSMDFQVEESLTLCNGDKESWWRNRWYWLTPRQEFKWKGKLAITNNKIERIRAEKKYPN